MEIHVTNYRRHFGGNHNETEHNFWTRHIPSAIRSLMPSLNIDIVDAYNMTGDSSAPQAGGANRMVIYGFHHHPDVQPVAEDYPFLPHRAEDKVLHIKDDAGNVMAEYDAQFNELFILFDVFKDRYTAGFDYVIKKLEELYFFPKTLENSWVHTRNRDKIIKTLNDTMRNQRSRYINQEKERIEGWKRRINEYRTEITHLLTQIDHSNKVVVVEEQSMNAFGEQILKDLDLIVAHEKVKDIHIKDGEFIVYTNPLYMYNKKDERFYLGNMTIKLRPEHSSIRFFGDNPRSSFWTDHDPHPHVSGSSGEACLGNASPLVAELSNQMQIYALTLTAIDFLEQANLDDVAGRNVYNWDMVDEEGKVIRKGGRRPQLTCYHCDEPLDEDDACLVYGYVDDDGPGEARQVCEDCRENHYHFDDEAEEYIAD